MNPFFIVYGDICYRTLNRDLQNLYPGCKKSFSSEKWGDWAVFNPLTLPYAWAVSIVTGLFTFSFLYALRRRDGWYDG